jgi:hypothetical protein
VKFPISGRSQSGRRADKTKNVREVDISPMLRARAHELFEQRADDCPLVGTIWTFPFVSTPVAYQA